MTVSEALYAKGERFYLAFEDDKGRKIGTYLIYGLGRKYAEGDYPIVLTDEARKDLNREYEEEEKEI